MGLFTRSLALGGLKFNGMYILLTAFTFILFAFSNPEKVNNKEKTTLENKLILESKEHLTENLSTEQSIFSTNLGYFEHENIPGKYSLMKARFGDESLVLRSDRIEFCYKATDGFEESLHLLFQNSIGKISPKGRKPITTKTVPVHNQAMANVLGSPTMEVTQYEEVVYENIYNGVNLIVKIDDDGLVFEVESLSKINLEAFTLTPWGVNAQDQTQSKSYSLKSNGGKSLIISSDKSDLIYSKSKGFNIASNSDADKVKFEISIK